MAKGGRPKTEVPMSIVDAACQLNATARQVIEILASQGHKVSHSTLVREIKRLHGVGFDEYRDQKTDLTRLKLVQKAVKMANDGNATMLIFCLKALCGWKETQKLEHTGKDGGPIESNAPQIIVTIPSNGREAKI